MRLPLHEVRISEERARQISLGSDGTLCTFSHMVIKGLDLSATEADEKALDLELESLRKKLAAVGFSEALHLFTSPDQ